MDIFDLIGPVMVGPSQLAHGGRGAHRLCGEKASRRGTEEREITLHGSFAATGRGHGTDKAIVAGAAGYASGRRAHTAQL